MDRFLIFLHVEPTRFLDRLTQSLGEVWSELVEGWRGLRHSQRDLLGEDLECSASDQEKLRSP